MDLIGERRREGEGIWGLAPIIFGAGQARCDDYYLLLIKIKSNIKYIYLFSPIKKKEVYIVGRNRQ